MILFNALKHHIGYIQTFIQSNDLDTAQEYLLSIGASQMDLYIGDLSAQSIENQIVEHLNKNNILNKTLFENFIENQKDFFEITLSDSSRWTLRKGNDVTHYIHIHPSRYSPHTLRVRAGILKTAIGLAILKTENYNTLIINDLRIELGLSPIKKMEDSVGLEKMVKILRETKSRTLSGLRG
jgi:hypothetical protein